MATLQLKTVPLTTAIQSTGDNANAIVAALPHGAVVDSTEGAMQITADRLKGRRARVDPGDWIVVMTLGGHPWIGVFTAAQYADLAETV